MEQGLLKLLPSLSHRGPFSHQVYMAYEVAQGCQHFSKTSPNFLGRKVETVIIGEAEQAEETGWAERRRWNGPGWENCISKGGVLGLAGFRKHCSGKLLAPGTPVQWVWDTVPELAVPKVTQAQIILARGGQFC